MIPETGPYQDVYVIALAMTIAVIATAYALWASFRHTGGAGNWKDRCAELDRRLSRMDTVFGSYPGLILVWEESIPDPDTGWGRPRVYGSAAALASMQRFADPGGDRNIAQRILAGLADLDTISEMDRPMTLRAHLGQLRRNGQQFSVTIVLPEGNVIEADGRVAGRQVVLWLEDASIRGEDERTAISRFESKKLLVNEDPVAFVEMLSRAPFPIWRISGNGRLLWVNDAYVSAVGGRTIQDVLENQTQLDAESGS